jgi:hypothetical protein
MLLERVFASEAGCASKAGCEPNMATPVGPTDQRVIARPTTQRVILSSTLII